jgi:DHA2 family multidrug resistance protein
MFVASRLAMRFDERMIMASGLLAMGWSMLVMSSWTPDVAQTEMMAVLFAQGFAMGLVLNPMTVMAFTTLAAHLRPEAASVQSLARNLGSAVGISVTTFTLSRSTQSTHADIAAGITPFKRALPGVTDLAARILDPTTRHGAAVLDQMVTYQAKIISYNNDFRLMTLTVIPPLILLFFLRRPAKGA